MKSMTNTRRFQKWSVSNETAKDACTHIHTVESKTKNEMAKTWPTENRSNYTTENSNIKCLWCKILHFGEAIKSHNKDKNAKKQNENKCPLHRMPLSGTVIEFTMFSLTMRYTAAAAAVAVIGWIHKNIKCTLCERDSNVVAFFHYITAPFVSTLSFILFVQKGCIRSACIFLFLIHKGQTFYSYLNVAKFFQQTIARCSSFLFYLILLFVLFGFFSIELFFHSFMRATCFSSSFIFFLLLFKNSSEKYLLLRKMI